MMEKVEVFTLRFVCLASCQLAKLLHVNSVYFQVLLRNLHSVTIIIKCLITTIH